MGFRGSRPGEHRGGRKKGTPNRLGSTLRLAFEQTFLALQKVKRRKLRDGSLSAPVALTDWATANPGEYYKLAARLIPQEMSGPGGGPIPLGVSGSVMMYVPDNGRAVPSKGNGG